MPITSNTTTITNINTNSSELNIYATITYVDGLIGDIDSVLDLINGEEV